MKKTIFFYFLINLIIFELLGFIFPVDDIRHITFMLLISLLSTLVFTAFVLRFNRKLNQVAKKVHQINVADDQTHLILPNNDPFHGLTHEINMLQSHIRHQTHQTQRQENELETLIKYLPIGVMVIDRFGDLQVANDGVQELFQRQFAPLPHPYQDDITQPELITLVNDAFHRQKSSQRLINLETAQGRKSIRVQVVYSEIRPKHFQITVLLSDVSDLVAMSKMQSDFVANASHELKTPITAISGFSETLLENPTDEATQQKFLTIIHEESQKLVSLINDILSLSHLRDNEVAELTLEPIKLAELAEEQLQNQQASAQLNHVKLINEIPADLVVTSDRGRLMAIMYNLLGNAIKYNKAEGTVTISASTGPDDWQLIVKDTGIGIPTNQQNRIFERFYRGDNGKRIAGTGLGLAIVAEQVAQMSGDINVTSELGVGTTMRISFTNENQ
ncbi:two-component system, OmpR family, phosphate regulon sensor histidine kinase PhoR [Secundilactobacillus oryzae JCM 18671]|uniref:histidine kinase n=1 Tax=Secundilactobacillus oryzae JCM 18671 TaxID=1291743 RepID=A0A081BGU7_9LACO|nr:HAMP domain-containing sensor histidine kinase [Secundilactobacillus oryzae]GAK47265.1 two-component system, OmpR family, phosphate regulon sensor histidine kinase PhoR [Secundilactobacillus oryzae JCM 18671]